MNGRTVSFSVSTPCFAQRAFINLSGCTIGLNGSYIMMLIIVALVLVDNQRFFEAFLRSGKPDNDVQARKREL